MHLSPLTGIETIIFDIGKHLFENRCIFHPLRGLKLFLTLENDIPETDASFTPYGD